MKFLQRLKQWWHYRWAVLTALMTALPMVWQAAPMGLQPHLPEWIRWLYMAVGLFSALHTWGTHVSDNKKVKKDGNG